MYDAQAKSTGSYVAREVNLAITIMLLCGGNALDPGVIFDIESCHCRKIMFHVLLH